MNGTNRRIVGIVAGVGLLFVLGPAAVASAGTTNKPYSLTIAPGTPATSAGDTTPGDVASGETVSISATFKNDAKTQQIGSANLAVPTGLTVVSASVPTGTATPETNCSVNGTTVPACVALRSLAIAPGTSATVTMSVQTPKCDPPGTSYAWSVEAKQANDYNGTPGNDFTFEASQSQLLTTVDGACSLAFVQEPQNEILGNAIDGVTPWFTGGATAGHPVTVQAETSTGALVPGFAGPVTAAIAVNAGGGSLNDTSPHTASNGVASFSDLELTGPANGYELSASSGTLTSATSGAFDLAGTAAPCSGAGNSCHTDASGNDGDGSVTANVVSGSGLLVESANANNGAQLTCSGSTSADPNTYSFETTTGLSANTVFTITIVGVKISGSVSKFLKAQQICFGSALGFTTANGKAAGAGTLPDGSSGFIGPLPNCTGSTTGPSEKSASATQVGSTYTVTLVANVPAKWAVDPWMK